MPITHAQIAPARLAEMLAAAADAARAIPPAFPLDATVAVNPCLGQMGENLAQTAARLSRVAGAPLTRPRSAYAAGFETGGIALEDLAEALEACDSPGKPADVAALQAALGSGSPTPRPLPTVADLAADDSGVDWPSIIMRCVGLWAAGHFDRGQALWTPAPGRSAFAAWREWASHDLTPEIAGCAGFCAHVAACPDTPERAILRAADALGLTPAAAGTAFHRLLMDFGGWAQHARWLLWEAELNGGTDTTVTDLLAVRLVWEEALLAQAGPDVAAAWGRTAAAHAFPVVAGPDQIIDAILQEAAERGHQRHLGALLQGTPAASPERPALQAAFCIDVRSEVFRRALEGLDPGIETIGFAGFFGLPVAFRGLGSDLVEDRLPVLLRPGLEAGVEADPTVASQARIRARAVRAWGRFRQAAVSSFAFVEAAGLLYAGKLLRDALGLGAPDAEVAPTPQFEPSLPAESKAETAAAILKAMSLTQGHARLVLLLGHGATVVNNPHASAYHCGACGGRTGEVSARLLARLLNDPETRAGLAAHGVDLARDTLFVAGLHDTTTDRVTLYREDIAAGEAARFGADLAQAKAWLARAGALTRAERAARLPGADPDTVADRARNWAEVRPEWGLAGCAAFIAAPRSATRRADLAGRAFLHSYDWRADAGFGTLELILTAPVVVASWISLQYYGSSVAPQVFGGGNKLIHNVVGGLGVVEGNGGALRPGLPWQTVHDGARLAHEPLRLSVFVEAPHEAILAVLEHHAELRALFDNGWLHLFTLENGQIALRYRPRSGWESVASEHSAAA